MFLKDELQSIISGARSVAKGDAIQAIANHIRKSKAASKAVEEKELTKEQEAAAILAYSRSHNFLFPGINTERFLAEGAPSHHRLLLRDGDEI